MIGTRFSNDIKMCEYDCIFFGSSEQLTVSLISEKYENDIELMCRMLHTNVRSVSISFGVGFDITQTNVVLLAIVYQRETLESKHG